MKKIFLILSAFLILIITGCSNSSESSNEFILAGLNSLTTNNRTIVTVEFSDSRTLMPVIYNSYGTWTWYAQLDDAAPVQMKEDNFGRYFFEVEAGKTYGTIKMTGTVRDSNLIYQSYNPKTMLAHFEASMSDVKFELNKRNSLIVPYSLVSVEFEDDTTQYYTDEITYGYDDSIKGVIAKVELSSAPQDDSFLSSLNGLIGNALLINKNDRTKQFSGTYDVDAKTYTFTVDNEEEVVEGLYDLVITYDMSYDDFFIGDCIFSNLDSLYIVKNNFVNANFTILLDKGVNTLTYYASMDSDAAGNGLTSDSPMNINDALDACVSSDAGLKTCYVYCGTDFVLDYNTLYDIDTGLVSKMPRYKKIHIITPKAKYVLVRDELDLGLSIYGNNIALRGTGSYTTFVVDYFADYFGSTQFTEMGSDDYVTINYYDGASLFVPYNNETGNYNVRINFRLDSIENLGIYNSAEYAIMQNWRYNNLSSNSSFIVRDSTGNEIVGKREYDSTYDTYKCSFGETSYLISKDGSSSGEYKIYLTAN